MVFGCMNSVKMMAFIHNMLNLYGIYIRKGTWGHGAHVVHAGGEVHTGSALRRLTGAARFVCVVRSCR